MRSQAIRYLILPGWQGSPAEHWQSHWQRTLPNASRVEQADWDNPDRASWVEALERAIDAERTPVILVAHSLGCVTVAHWAAQSDPDVLRRVRGALLVAPADVQRPGCPEPLKGFAPIPRELLPFPTLLVADAQRVRFLGPLTPQAETLRRLLRATVLDAGADSTSVPTSPEVAALAAGVRQRQGD